MLRVFKIPNFVIVLFFFSHVLSLAQKPNVEPRKVRKDSYDKLPTGKIRTELSFFNIEGGHYEQRDSLVQRYLDIIPFASYSDSAVLFKARESKIYLASSRFDTTNKSFGYHDDNSKDKFLVYIQGKPFWGTDGRFPNRRIASISYRDANTQLLVPDTAFNDLFEPNFCLADSQKAKSYCLTNVYRSKDKRRIYIHMLNGDGAGGYEVTFIIQDKKYYGRVVDYGF